MAPPLPFLTLHVTPRGQLVAAPEDAAPPVDTAAAERIADAFASGAGDGLLQLGASEVTTPLPAVLRFWRDFANRYVTTVCHAPDEVARAKVDAPTIDELSALAASAPPMTGLEYL